MNQIISAEKTFGEAEYITKMCKLLMKQPHYAKIGEEGIFAIVEKARSVGIHPFEALNGGMYFLGGKVELSAAMMNQLIRAAGHSITKDRRSDNTICILHGKRADNHDTWTEYFSMEDAELANLQHKMTYKQYPRDLLFARALSRLARQLFPDVIKGCYVQGEIGFLGPDAADEPTPAVVDVAPRQPIAIENESKDVITPEQLQVLESFLGDNEKLRSRLLRNLKSKLDCDSFDQMPAMVYEQILDIVKEAALNVPANKQAQGA